jgi:hypothetical protein
MHKSNQTIQVYLTCSKNKNTCFSSNDPPKFLLYYSRNGSWRNTCSKTLRAKEWKKDGTRKRERESGKSRSITIAQDMVNK